LFTACSCWIWEVLLRLYSLFNCSSSGHTFNMFLNHLQVLGLGSVAVVLARSALLVVGSVAASRQLHHRLLTKMLRLPMSFYDAQPTGG
jgi:ABC-type bacteriocin/lantibiotic exporter with double-glycine peptidase domain